MYEQYETDPVFEKNGIWIDYGDFRVKIARAGGANKSYMKYAEVKTKPFRRAISAGSMPEERSRGLLYDIYAETVILDWETSDGVDKDNNVKWKNGIGKKGGGILPVTKENIITTFKNLPAVFSDLQQAAEGIALFRAAEMGEDGKN